MLRPYDRREAITVEEAADLSGWDVRTIRRWCVEQAIGPRIAGGPWAVSVVALSMLLSGDDEALRLYLRGDRVSARVAAYFEEAGLGSLDTEMSRSRACRGLTART